MAHLCTLMGIRDSPRTAYSTWTNGLVKVQSRNLTTHLRMFLHDSPKYWAFQVRVYALAHDSQPLSELNVSPHEIVFHTQPRMPLTFDLNLNRNTSKLCISKYCSQLPKHSHYDKINLNPSFYKRNKTFSKPIPQWFLAVETAMLPISSTVYENTLKKKETHMHILQNNITKENHFPLALLFSNKIFLMFIFLRNSNHFGLDHIKFMTDYLTLHTNFSHRMALQYMFIETT